MEPDLVDYERLDGLADTLREDFAAADPFPHVVIDDFLSEEVAEGLLGDFDEAHEGWKHYHHFNERKLALTDYERMPAHTQRVLSALQSRRAVQFIEKLSGFESLVKDPDLEGAGMHLVRRGGFLNVHTDFLTHTKKTSWRRRINLLLYLNKDWQEEWQTRPAFSPASTMPVRDPKPKALAKWASLSIPSLNPSW